MRMRLEDLAARFHALVGADAYIVCAVLFETLGLFAVVLLFFIIPTHFGRSDFFVVTGGVICAIAVVIAGFYQFHLIIENAQHHDLWKHGVRKQRPWDDIVRSTAMMRANSTGIDFPEALIGSVIVEANAAPSRCSTWALIAKRFEAHEDAVRGVYGNPDAGGVPIEWAAPCDTEFTNGYELQHRAQARTNKAALGILALVLLAGPAMAQDFRERDGQCYWHIGAVFGSDDCKSDGARAAKRTVDVLRSIGTPTQLPAEFIDGLRKALGLPLNISAPAMAEDKPCPVGEALYASGDGAMACHSSSGTWADGDKICWAVDGLMRGAAQCVPRPSFMDGFNKALGVAPDPSWHLLTQTYGGTMQLQKGLTEKECRFMEARALGKPATDEEKAAQSRGQAEAEKYCRTYSDGSTTDDHDWTRVCKDGVPGAPFAANRRIWDVLGGPPSTVATAECFQ